MVIPWTAALLTIRPTDVAIETTIYAKPWWATAHGEAGHGSHPEHDEVHQILPACSSPAANAAPCVIQADSGVFDTDGTTRLDAGATTGTSVVLTWLGDAASFEARLDLAPISPIGTGGFSVPADKVSRISVSWPTERNSLRCSLWLRRWPGQLFTCSSGHAGSGEPSLIGLGRKQVER